jgi:hypothetical protein
MEARPRRGRRNRSARANNSRHPAGDPIPPTVTSGAIRHGKSVHRAGISPELPSLSRHSSTVSPLKSSVDQPSTSTTRSRSSPGAVISRTRSGKTSTT